MSFSIRNGLKMTWYHLHQADMVIAFLLFALPSIVVFQSFGVIWAILWLLIEFMLIVFIRAWEDPVKLGYEVDENED